VLRQPVATVCKTVQQRFLGQPLLSRDYVETACSLACGTLRDSVRTLLRVVGTAAAGLFANLPSQ
jgi:hypothetical protein